MTSSLQQTPLFELFHYYQQRLYAFHYALILLTYLLERAKVYQLTHILSLVLVNCDEEAHTPDFMLVDSLEILFHLLELISNALDDGPIWHTQPAVKEVLHEFLCFRQVPWAVCFAVLVY